MDWNKTGFSEFLAESDVRTIALADYLTGTAAICIGKKHMDDSLTGSEGGWAGPKGGAFNINAPGQAILPRTSAMVMTLPQGMYGFCCL